MKVNVLQTWAQHVLFVFVALACWEWGARTGWIDPSFVGSPLGIAQFTLDNSTNARLWGDLGWTLAAVFSSFVIGSVAAIATGLLFVSWPKFETFCDPYIAALNVLPRIALIPLFILWFGLGIGSKIAMGVSLTFFIVLSTTVAGIRGVSQDHVTLTRTLGASSHQMFFWVTLPGAVPVLFSGLRLGLIYAFLGVVGAEVIASERGLGQQLAYLGSTFNVDGVWSLLFDLALIGVLIMKIMNWLERRLLHWQ
jgi:NitT/TauT family transport system permease protein